jgi:hypothetical protein
MVTVNSDMLRDVKKIQCASREARKVAVTASCIACIGLGTSKSQRYDKYEVVF